MINRVRQFARRHELWANATRIVAAVSGGSDSVALLQILHGLHASGELRLDAVAHLNHGIRGAESDADEAFCRTLAARLDVAFVAERVDVPALAGDQGTSLEVAARTARQTFLEHVRRARGADVIATAHTADDQAETVILRIVRGAGLRGLSAIAPRRGAFIRPLLECRRDELRAELAARGQSWREDATNLDLDNPRNRVRHELLPYLGQHFNPRVIDALARLADLAREDDDLLDRQSASATARVVCREADRLTINAAALAALPTALARRVVRAAVRAVSLGAVSVDDVDRIRDVAAGLAGAVELSDLRVEHSDEFVVLVTKSAPAPLSAPFSFDLSIPGSVEWPPGGWGIDAEGPIIRSKGSSPLSAPDQVEVDAARLESSVVVRRREPGDWIRPIGLNGRKKLQDVFVDRKVRRDQRDLVPVITDRHGRLIWVAGHVLDRDFRVTSDTNAVVILKLRRF